MKISFKLQTIIGIALIEGVLLILLVWSSLNYLYESNVDEFSRRTSLATKLFSTTVKDAVLSTDLASLESHTAELMRNPGIVYVRIRDLQKVIAQRGESSILERPFRRDYNYEQVDDGIYDTQIQLTEGTYEFGKIEIGFSISNIDDILSAARQHISTIALIEITLVGIFSLILGTLLTRQLDALKNAANTIRRLGPGSQVKVSGHDELAETAMAFNAMSSELENTYGSLREAMQQSNEQKEKVNAVMDNVPSGIVLLNEAGNILSTNRSMDQLVNLSKETMENTSISDVIQNWSMMFDELRRQYHSSMDRKKGWDETSIIRKDGSLLPVQISLTTIQIHNEIQYIVVIRDISAQIMSEKQLNQVNDMLVHSVTALEEKNTLVLILTQLSSLLQKCLKSEEAYQNIGRYGELLFPGLTGSLYIKNEDGYMRQVTTWGIGDEPVQKFHHTDCWALRGASIHPASLTEHSAQCNHVKQITGPSSQVDICMPISASGDMLGLLYLRGNKKQASRIDRAFADVVREQIGMALFNINLQSQLLAASIRDPLTGLYNRRFMEESFKREISRANRNNLDLSVIMLDIDHFKKINDSLGHNAGDHVLTQLSSILKDSCRSQDVLCRYGGEEFLLIYPDTEISIATTLIERILTSIRELAITYEKKSIHITASAGVASYRSNGGNAELLIEMADKALYEAKENGRDQLKTYTSKHTPKLVTFRKKPKN